MSYNENLLFYLLRIGLETETKYDFKFTERPNWKFIFKMSSVQGISAIVFDGLDYLVKNNLINKELLPSHVAKMQWGMNVMKIEDVYDHQYRLANELADKYHEEGLKTVVLKGIASAVLYPKPNHRPCGDLDCYLMGDYEKGNVVAEKVGAEVDRDCYKHSHVVYKGFMVENHQFCTAIRGKKNNKYFERELQNILNNSCLEPINGTNLLSPDSLFNALFLTIHAWGHFMLEGIKLRQLCDWAELLIHHKDDINWDKFKKILAIRDSKMFFFAQSFSIISNKYLGIEIPSIFIENEDTVNLSRKVLHSILYDDDSIYNQKYSLWKSRCLFMKNIVRSRWKFKAFSDESAFGHITSRSLYTLFERNPHL